MREESHIEEMRAAVRGDRERAEQARQRSTENVLALIDAPAAEEAREPQPEAQPEPERRRGLLSRFLGR